MIHIRAMTVTDCESVAALHRSAAPDQKNVQLGRRYLTALFTYFARTERSTALVAIGGGDLVGYCIGARQPYRAHMVLRLGPHAIPAMLRHPRLWYPAVGAVIGALKSTRSSHDESKYGAQYSLVGIAVHPAWRRQHVGERLIRAFCEAAPGSDDPMRFRLSVKRDNLGARRLYERAGWVAAHANASDVITYELVYD